MYVALHRRLLCVLEIVLLFELTDERWKKKSENSTQRFFAFQANKCLYLFPYSYNDVEPIAIFVYILCVCVSLLWLYWWWLQFSTKWFQYELTKVRKNSEVKTYILQPQQLFISLLIYDRFFLVLLCSFVALDCSKTKNCMARALKPKWNSSEPISNLYPAKEWIVN